MYKFPYREAGTTLDGEPNYRPIVDAEISFGTNALRTVALVDTGAPITIFDYGTAEALLVRLNHLGAEHGTMRLLGKQVRLQFELVDLCLLTEDGESSPWLSRVGFILDPQFEMPFQGVLGHAGFLDKWAVTFNSPYGYFLVQHPDDAPDTP